MDLAFITPTAYLERFSTQGDIYLALAHLIDDSGLNDYASFHRREALKGRRVILDNGLFEGAQVEAESLLRRAKAIHASVVCAPDILYDSAGTIKEFKNFIKAKQEFGLQCDVMGIPQADNPDDWWKCFRFMDLSNDCQLLGLSILSIPQSFEKLARKSGAFFGKFQRISFSRLHLLRQLHAYQKLAGRRITPCHLLGLGESLADVTFANRLLPDTVVSNDSSSAFIHGKQNIRYTKIGIIPGGKDHTPLDFDLSLSAYNCGTKVGNPDYDPIQHNINIALGLAHFDWSKI